MSQIIYEQPEIYIYGMTVMSTIHLLKDDYPKEDTYGEIVETHHVPGGEAGNSSIILGNLGYKVKLDGPFLGKDSYEGVCYYCKKYNVDCSNMIYDSDFSGVKDIVLVANHTRTVFGWFGAYFSDVQKRWTIPDYNAMSHAKVIGLDPYFPESSDAVAQYCLDNHKPLVSIDSPYDSLITKASTVMIVSKEYIHSHYPNIPIETLFRLYTDNCSGLVIFTFGSEPVLFGRKNEVLNRFKPYKVDVKSTLGAGDTFRAGVIYGIYNNLTDLDLVRFASATAGCVISTFPMAYKPPTLIEIESLIATK